VLPWTTWVVHEPWHVWAPVWVTTSTAPEPCSCTFTAAWPGPVEPVGPVVPVVSPGLLLPQAARPAKVTASTVLVFMLHASLA